MRTFQYARKVTDNGFVEKKAYSDARLPEYSTKYTAGADFFCAEEVVVPSIWKSVLKCLMSSLAGMIDPVEAPKVEPTLVHTGIKANMEDDEVLEIYNRSSNPKRLGLILANSVGIMDKDYYGNSSNDGEIMFAFYNFKPWDVTVKVGDRIGQGIFKKCLRPTVGLVIKDVEREGGFGSTGR